MTPELLSSLAGILLSLAFTYLPGLAAIFEVASPNTKRLVIVAALLLVTAGMYAWSVLQGTPADLPDLLEAFILALVSSQAAYLVSPKINVKPLDLDNPS
jgi:hypothetical protein